MGAILVKLAEYAEAIGPLKKATDLDPENTRAIELLEDAEAGKRRIDYAAERAKKEMQANSNTAGRTSDASANSNSANAQTPEIKQVKTPSPPANRPN